MSFRLFSRKHFVVVSLLAAAGVLFLGFQFAFDSLWSRQKAGHKTTTVVQSRFVRVVPVTGEIRCYRPTVIFNDCRAPERQIIELVEEGSWVNKGDVVCRLDCSGMQETLRIQQTELLKAKAGFDAAVTREELQFAENDRFTDRSVQQQLMDQRRLTEFVEGTSANQLQQLQNRIQLSRDEVAQAAETVSGSERMMVMGFARSSQYQSDTYRFDNLAHSLDRQNNEYSLIQKYEHPSQLMRLNGNARFSSNEIQRTQLQNELRSSFRAIDKLNMRRWIAGVQRYVNYLTQAIDACTMRAPKSGKIIFNHKPDEQRIIELGSVVYYTQTLFRITDRSRLIISGKVNDRLVYAMNEGDPVEFTVSTIPDRVFTGSVDWIGSIPKTPKWYQSGGKYHELQIFIDGDADELTELSPSMTADVNVIADDRDNVVQVPVGAVCTHNHQHVVLVQASQDKVERRVVQVGDQAGQMIEVKAGLYAGEQVIMGQRAFLRELADELTTAKN